MPVAAPGELPAGHLMVPRQVVLGSPALLQTLGELDAHVLGSVKPEDRATLLPLRAEAVDAIRAPAAYWTRAEQRTNHLRAIGTIHLLIMGIRRAIPLSEDGDPDVTAHANMLMSALGASDHPLAEQAIMRLPAAIRLLESAAAQDSETRDGQPPDIAPGNITHRLAMAMARATVRR